MVTPPLLLARLQWLQLQPFAVFNLEANLLGLSKTVESIRVLQPMPAKYSTIFWPEVQNRKLRQLSKIVAECTVF
jgi:hypothetical protein